jgi:hypothetical protein
MAVTILWRKAEIARVRAEERWMLAMKAITQFHLSTSSAIFQDTKGELNHYVLRDQLAYLRTLEPILEQDPGIAAQMTLINNLNLESLILTKLGREEEAFEASLKELMARNSLARRNPDKPALQAVLPQNPSLAKLSASRTLLEAALTALSESEEILKKAIESKPSRQDPETKFDQAIHKVLLDQAESIPSHRSAIVHAIERLNSKKK